MATIGGRLLQPESGWKRMNSCGIVFNLDSFKNIHNADLPWYKNDVCVSDTGTPASLMFKFGGSKLRIISRIYPSCADDVKITIDDTIIDHFKVNEADVYNALVYEITDLEDIIHTVKIETGDQFYFEAIDIDENVDLFHPFLPTKYNTDDMEIGDAISCEYVATANSVGTFSNLGKAKKDLLSYHWVPEPNGSFFFIKVTPTLLVPDRVLQTNISWDIINKAGYAEGIVISERNIQSVIPNMTGNTQPEGQVFASSRWGGWTVYDAFNTNDKVWVSNGARIGYIGYTFTQPCVIKGYSLIGTDVGNLNQQPPIAWTFEGSNDKTNWTVLDTQAFDLQLDVFNWFPVNNNTKFLHYRINITATLNNQYPTLQFIGMYKDQTKPQLIQKLIRCMSGGSSYLGYDFDINNPNPDTISTDATDLSPSYDITKIFDTGGGLYLGSTTTERIYIQFSYEKGIIVKGIQMSTIPFGAGNEPLKDFTLVGSNDNFDTEEVLYKGINKNKTTKDLTDHVFKNSKRFKEYRFYCDSFYAGDGHGGQNLIQLRIITNLKNPKSSLVDKKFGAFPPNNEWDKYLINSNLNGKITPGDVNIWHNDVSSSWTKETPVENFEGVSGLSGFRILRGGVDISNRVRSIGRKTAQDYTGFRPVIQLKHPKQKNILY